MNDAFKDLANGAFEKGLQKLKDLCQWYDDSDSLDGPFFLGFPGAKGWGEGLLVASLLKRYGIANSTRVRVFAQSEVCSILRHDDAFDVQAVTNIDEGISQGARSPLAILKAALTGDLLQLPFVKIETDTTNLPSRPPSRRRAGIAWASMSNDKPILEKSIPLVNFLSIFGEADLDVVSFQRDLSVPDREDLCKRFNARFSVVSAKLEAKDQAEVVGEVLGLDCMITISTTTAHIAACLGVPVILLAANRAGPQWFWRAQGEYEKCFYPSVNVMLGGKNGEWWKDCVLEAQQLLLNQSISC